MATIEKSARFDFIRYANCWEDADILLEALSIKPGQKCLSICSSGDNSLSMLVHEPELVLAIDLNPAQLACLEIRIAAFKELTYEDLLAFVGIQPNNERTKTFELIKSQMSPASSAFWDKNVDLIEKGIIYGGKFEKYFGKFQNYILPLMHKKSTLEELVSEKSIQEQHQFYESQWNNFRWRFLFKIFFGRFVMGRLGRDPEFFKYVDENVGLSILNRTRYAFTEIPTYSNPYLNFIMTGHFTLNALPFYLRKENFQLIKDNIKQIKPFQGNIQSCLQQQITFDAFNLSDIFEYMNMLEFTEELMHIVAMGNHDARIAYWNMLSDRIIPEDIPIRINETLSQELAARDKAWFYKRFIVGFLGN